ncbi:g5486 [Coccomyxa elongata]
MDISNAAPAEAPQRPARYGANFPEDDLGDEMSVARVALSTNAGLNRTPTAKGAALRGAEAGRRWLRGARRAVVRVANPPLVGVLAGILVGVTPLGRLLYRPDSPAAVAHTLRLPIELRIVGLIGGATLAVQTVVLGASLFQKAARPLPDPAAFGEGDRPPGSPGGPLRPGQVQIITPGASGSGDEANASQQRSKVVWSEARLATEGTLADQRQQGASTSGRVDGLGQANSNSPDQNLLRMLLPRDAVDTRMFAAVAVVRLLLMPAVTLALVRGLAALQLLPADPVCALTLLVQGAMPSAQNLVLLAQLRRGTQPLAPRMAALLLRLYAFAVIPVTLWMTLYAYNLPATAAAAAAAPVIAAAAPAIAAAAAAV